MSLKKNDVIELEITGFSSEGSGVGHFDGQAVFVNGTATGDTVQCVIIKAKKNYAIGKLQNILKASPDRIIPDCPAFPRCGGCQYRHISYEAEKRIKTDKVRDAFKRIGHLDIIPEEAVGAENTARYRNKAQFPVETANGRLLAGFYAPFSHRVIDCKDCLLQPREFSDILKITAKWCEKYKIPTYDESTRKGLLRHIYIRKAFNTGEIMVCLVINGDKIFKQDELISALLKANSNIKTLLLNFNTEDTNVIMGKKEKVLYGKGYIEDILCGKRFRISPLSFYQVNHDGAELLYNTAKSLLALQPGESLLDLYCGIGTIGMSLAEDDTPLVGIEIVPQAIENAKENAARNGMTNAQFFCGDASDAGKILSDCGIRADAVVVDPPRKGLTPEVIAYLAELNPSRIVYISCDADTLARDIVRFREAGYDTDTVQPVDMFSRTGHVECVTKFTHRTK